MNLNRILMFWRLLFIALLLISSVLGLRIASELQIDTNLADVSPSIQNTPETRSAIAKLTENVEQRILLLISGEDDDSVFESEQQLRNRLSNISELSILPTSEVLAETLTEGIKPFRFSLLSEDQRAELISSDAEAIAQQAKASLFGLSEQIRLYPFADDPLGWHSNTLLALLDNPSAGLSNVDSAGFNTVVNLRIDHGAMNMNAQQSLMADLNIIIAEMESGYPVTVDRSGVFFFAAQAAKDSKQDISRITIGSGIGVILLLLFAFRSLRALLLPFISIALGVGFAFVATHLIYGSVHILTIVFGASLIGIVIDYSLHYFYHGAQADETDNSERQALHRAMLLSLMTSLIGYAALSFSDLQALQKVALVSCCGLLMAWLSVICLGDWALRHRLITDKKIFPFLVSALSRPLKVIKPVAWAAISGMVVVAATGIVLFSQPFDDDPRVFFNASETLIASERKVAAVANDYEPGRYLIVHGISNDDVYQRHERLFNLISESDLLDAGDFTSILAWIPKESQQNDDYVLQEKLYGDDGAAQKLLTDISTQTPFSSTQQAYRLGLTQRLTPDHVAKILGDALPPLWLRSKHNTVNFVLIKKGVNADELAALVEPIEGVEYINTLARTRTALAQQRESATNLLLLAYALVALLVLVRYRQLSSLWLVVVPICSSAMLVILGFMFAFSLNLFHVMALFLVLGFGMDYTIFAREITHRQSVTLQAILLSALTSLLSFGLLGLSSIPVVASFGITLLIGNLFNLLGVFVYTQTQNATTQTSTKKATA
jgi:predicted exporter